MTLFRKYDYFILTGPAHPGLTAFFGIAFDQYFKSFAEILLVAFFREPVLQLNDFIQPSFLGFFGYVIPIASRRKRSRSFTVEIHIAQIKPRIIHQAQR